MMDVMKTKAAGSPETAAYIFRTEYAGDFNAMTIRIWRNVFDREGNDRI